ncbi:MAG: 50S ribosomal protein L29 [Tissierellales bacterium]|jgi:large subunit ribosomal protein L29|nr:50S ribosomal protein L29 [Tissierellales bacterium]MBN2827142.1 50S ribosomal protein L29 [Tissierellales bacterium]
MKANVFKEKTVSELNAMLVDLKTELFNLRFQLATGQLDNTSRIKVVKKDIARVKTVLREHELNVGM